MWVGTHVYAYNLCGFDDEKEEEKVVEQEEGEVGESELEGVAPTPKMRKLQHSVWTLACFLRNFPSVIG